MPTLAENTTQIKVAIAKPKGMDLTQLGVPLLEGSVIKKGKLTEFIQNFEDGKPGRRYQNIRILGAKTLEGGTETAKVFVQFEVFGDENVPLAANSGFAVGLCAGDQSLLDLPAASAFLPYAGSWYENQYFYEIPTAIFDQWDAVAFTIRADDVRMI